MLVYEDNNIYFTTPKTASVAKELLYIPSAIL